MPSQEKSFLARVRSALPTLHPAERRLGEFVCDFPGELASYSGSELAALAHVSKATVSRFVQRLGYDSYESARRHAREEKQTGSRLFLASAAKAGSVQTVQAHITQGIANLEATFLSITDAQIDAATQALLEDPEWFPVFADDTALVFVLNVPEHREVIAHHGLPRNRPLSW